MGSSEMAWLLTELGISSKSIKYESSFDDRLKVQKGTFLLNYLDVAPFNGFSFDMYLSGPYSRAVTAEYYSLEGVPPDEPSGISETERNLLHWFTDHDTVWLEIASSILLIKSDDKDLQSMDVLKILLTSKPWVKVKMFLEIYSELADHGLIKP